LFTLEQGIPVTRTVVTLIDNPLTLWSWKFMKKSISTTCFFLLVFFIIVVVPAVGSADDSPWNRKLPFKELAIHYIVSGMENGTETLFIQDYGQRRALVHEGTTSIMGVLFPKPAPRDYRSGLALHVRPGKTNRQQNSQPHENLPARI